MTKRKFIDHTCKAIGCTNLAEKDSYGIYKSYCSDTCNPRKKDRTCLSDGCNGFQRKNHFGNYNKYCSDECSAKSFTSKIKTTYQAKTIEDKNTTNNKRKETTLEIYGVDNVSRSEIVKSQIREKQIEKYGGWYSSTDEGKKVIADAYNKKTEEQKATIKEFQIRTCQELFGANWATQSKDIANKISITMSSKQDQEWFKIKSLAKETNRELYSNENYNNRIQFKETCLEKFGVENPSQNEEVHAKKLLTGYRSKTFIFPSGKAVMIQGYEDRALDELLKTYHENEIIVETTRIPAIKYIKEDGTNHIYFPDIYIPKDNLLIEVKSQYTYNIDLKTNLAKEKYSIISGYNFRFMIL